MKRILYIDDDPLMLSEMKRYVEERFPGIKTLTCQDPMEGIRLIDPTLDLLIIDLEMPAIDGKKLLSYAISLGIDKKKIIIISGLEADYLHEAIPTGYCLCVLNKNEAKQREVLDMVLSSVEKK